MLTCMYASLQLVWAAAFEVWADFRFAVCLCRRESLKVALV